MKDSKLFKSLVATFVVIVLGGPAVVLAHTPGDFFQDGNVAVSYKDLNLESEQGARVLYRRLQNASKDVCGVTHWNIAVAVGRITKARQCYSDALSNAVAEIDNDDLTRIHAG